MWNTAVNVNAWLVVVVCDEARGGEKRIENEGGKGGERQRERERGGGLTCDAASVVQRVGSTWPKRPAG